MLNTNISENCLEFNKKQLHLRLMEYNVIPNKKKTNRKRSALLCCRGRIEIKYVLS